MARLWSSGFELGSTSTLEWDVAVGSPTIVTSPVRSGTYALGAVLSASINSGFQYSWSAADQQVPTYIKLHMRVHTRPATNILHVLQVRSGSNTGTTTLLALILNTNGTLQLYDYANGVNVGSPSSVLNLDQYYRIEVKVDPTTLASVALDARIDGASFATGTVSWANGIGALFVGLSSITHNNETATVYFDDVAINDNSTANQNTWPGDTKIIHLHPNAAGDNTGWSLGSYNSVMEVTPDDSGGYDADHTLNNTSDWNIDDTPGSIGASDTINVIHLGLRLNADGVSSATFVGRIKSQSGGTVSESSGIVPVQGTWNTNATSQPHNYPLTLYQTPGGATITKANLDTTQIGVRTSVGNTNNALVTAAWLLVDYTPAAASSVLFIGGISPSIKIQDKVIGY